MLGCICLTFPTAYSNAPVQAEYSCTEAFDTRAKIDNRCHEKEACQFETSSDYEGNKVCPDKDDAEVGLCLVYSCECGTPTDRTDSANADAPKCPETR